MCLTWSFICIVQFNTKYYYKTPSQKSGCKFRSLMSKPYATMAKKISLRQHEVNMLSLTHG